ncbi:MAG: PepSY domain-containing protein [Nitrospira defluvii]|nr:PepSY domain-containing protein [Nitrospira defluvii]
MKKISFVTVFMVGIMLTLGGLAWSAKGPKGPKGAELVNEATVTIDQAIKTAREKVSGPVGEAELKQKDGKTVWEVEIAGADSKVMKVFLDATTGTVLSTEEKKPKEHKPKADPKKG